MRGVSGRRSRLGAFSCENSAVGFRRVTAPHAASRQDRANSGAPDHLRHAGEIVLPVDGLDAVTAVVGPVGHAVPEADHRGDDVRGGDVRNVEALHDAGRCGKLEGILEGGRSAAGSMALGKRMAGETAHRLGRRRRSSSMFAKLGGPLEIELRGGVAHLVLEFVDQSPGFAGEEIAGLLRPARGIVPRVMSFSLDRAPGSVEISARVRVGSPRPKVSTPNFLRMKLMVSRSAPAMRNGPK